MELEELFHEISQFTRRSSANAQAHELSAERDMIFLVIVGSLVSMIMSYILIKSIVQSLNVAVSHAREMADGNLTEVIEIKAQDEIGRLLSAMLEMQGKLEESVNTIKTSSNSVLLAAKEVSEEGLNLSHRTQEQAASLEEITSSIEELSGTVTETADNASKATQLVDKSREQVEEVNVLVIKAVVAMNEISDSSGQIAQINSVIKDIAFQTNLLALNAAVEAARAGDQGRGFAVVAGEVRNLAGRCQTAAKEINDLIDNSVAKVKAGTSLVDDTGSSLAKIVDSITEVSALVLEVKSANTEQSSGLKQISGAITTVDDLVQHNAASVEESASAGEVLLAQAHSLDDLVSYFKTSDDNGAKHRGLAKDLSARQVVINDAASKLKRVPRHDLNITTNEVPSRKQGFVRDKPASVGRSGSSAVSLKEEDWQEF